MLIDSSVQNFAEDYFSGNNFLSKKILTDIASVRESYEDAWDGMDQSEREQVTIGLDYYCSTISNFNV